ncbi:MAG: hypothetical protein BWY83_02856 [bacterium ADurb.Bin478]|nr:MAG: hypothetical protein BWY83_02856 [bacterium ADurb.Bin478]
MIPGLGKTVGVERQQIAGLQRYGFFFQYAIEQLAALQTQRQTAGSQGGAGLLPQMKDRIMACADERQGAGLSVKHAVDHADKMIAIHILPKQTVDLAHHFGRWIDRACQRAQKTLGQRHVKCRRDALAGHIADGNAQMLIIKRQKVIIIAGHLQRRPAETGDLQSLDLRILLGQKIALYIPRNLQLAAQPHALDDLERLDR